MVIINQLFVRIKDYKVYKVDQLEGILALVGTCTVASYAFTMFDFDSTK